MARLLARTSPATVVLDAACDAGVNAAALAHRGNSCTRAVATP
jgi:hypothetical protein